MPASMTDPTWISVLPPVLAIVLAITTRQVYLSLAAGVWMGATILAGWAPLAGLADSVTRVVAVLTDRDNAEVILFTLAIGALIATVEASGGVRGFVDQLESRRWVDTPRRAGILVVLIGVVIFIESNITILVGGAVGRPLFDRFRMSRERLAYLLDSTSAPICMLIPLNAWGALVVRLIGDQGIDDPVRVLAKSIPYNFYGLAAVTLAFIVALTRLEIGPMRRAEQRTQTGELLWPTSTPVVDPDVLAPPSSTRIPPRAINMVLPLASMVVMMLVALWITGRIRIGRLIAEGVLTPDTAAREWALLRGSGSTSVLWAVLVGLAVAWVLLLGQRAFSVDRLVKIGLKGAGGLVGLALILLLALSLAGVARELQTGAYIAQVTEGAFRPALFLPLVFIVAAVTGFCTGTSWGTFALMLPLAIPVALSLNLPPAAFVAAALSGGVFGDHASPISDTTIISSMAAATDHIDHVRTQLPYALIAGGVAAAAFAVTGALI
jgi:tetracycline resistance efflux pump